MPPSIEQIPAAAQLQQQLDVLNTAIAALGSGSTITNLTVSSPPPAEGAVPGFIMPIPVILNPPISGAATIADLTTYLQAQADALEQQLVTMGYAPSASKQTG
jgi:hypothetical protein